MKHARILTIQDYSSVGRCSLTAALPIISACGQDPVGLPTALLSTQTSGIIPVELFITLRANWYSLSPVVLRGQ